MLQSLCHVSGAILIKTSHSATQWYNLGPDLGSWATSPSSGVIPQLCRVCLDFVPIFEGFTDCRARSLQACQRTHPLRRGLQVYGELGRHEEAVGSADRALSLIQVSLPPDGVQKPVQHCWRSHLVTLSRFDVLEHLVHRLQVASYQHMVAFQTLRVVYRLGQPPPGIPDWMR